MLLLTLLSLQAAEPQPDLRSKILPERCRAATPREDEIVVCGRHGGPSPYRIGAPAPTPLAIPEAQFNISEGVEAKLSGEQGEVGGFATNRAMFSVKIKF